MDRFDHDVNKMLDEWKKLKRDLQEGLVDYDDMETIKTYDFFKWFHEMIKYVKPEVSVDYSEIKNVFRAVHHDSLTHEEHDRLIPKKEHAVINKMNPENRLFLYLCFHNDEDKEDLIKHTCAKEIRAEEGQKISVCKFELKDDEDKKIIDLTHNNIPIQEHRFAAFVKEEYEKGGEDAMRRALMKVAFEVFTLDGTFKPIEGDEDELEYSPFHALSNLFENEGFDGMIFRSMVVTEGKNLVLFNHEDAKCIPNTIHQHIVRA